MDGANGSISWLTSAWENTGYTLSLGVPMIPTNSLGQPQGSLALGASGSYNPYFKTLASALVAAGEGDAYLRLGWEFDGNWYAWQAQTAVSETEYAEYFRQIVTAMRSVTGAQFKFVWNPDASAFTHSSYSVAAAYPGSAYVNDIGLDLYDMSWATPNTPENAWTSTYLPELTAAESFAQTEGKPIAFCEWGTLIRSDAHGLGDDPLYISNMINWMKAPSHDVAYESYFNGPTTEVGGSLDQNLIGQYFPNSMAAFTAALS
jgi:Glycosyl hydrolase family 26